MLINPGKEIITPNETINTQCVFMYLLMIKRSIEACDNRQQVDILKQNRKRSQNHNRVMGDGAVGFPWGDTCSGLLRAY